MRIELCFYASLAILLPSGTKGSACFLEIEAEETIEQLLKRFKVPEDQPRLTFLNGLHARENDILKDGDRLAVFPPIAGG